MIRYDRMTQGIINKMLSNNWTPAGADEESNNPGVSRRGGRGGGLDAPLAELPTKKKRAPKSVDQKEEEEAGDGTDGTSEEEDAERDEDEDGEVDEDQGQKRSAGKDEADDAPPAKQAKSEKPTDVSFSLIHRALATDASLGTLQKPYLRTSAGISMLHLKKYLVSKFQGTPGLKPEQIVLTCRDQECSNSTKVGEIAEEIWKDSSKDLELVYYSLPDEKSDE